MYTRLGSMLKNLAGALRTDRGRMYVIDQLGRQNGNPVLLVMGGSANRGPESICLHNLRTVARCVHLLAAGLDQCRQRSGETRPPTHSLHVLECVNATLGPKSIQGTGTRRAPASGGKSGK